jgi:hypothetical protein
MIQGNLGYNAANIVSALVDISVAVGFPTEDFWAGHG